MSIPQIQTTNAAGSLPVSGPPQGPGYARGEESGLRFDQFQRLKTTPDLHVGKAEKLRLAVFHPLRLMGAIRKTPKGGVESAFERVKMINALKGSLKGESRKHLNNLLKAGVLNDADTDDGHSALYHLYAMATTRRGRGYENQKILSETLEILDRPYLITQKFAPLSENVAREILSTRNAPGLNRAGVAPGGKPLGWNELNVENSATCVSSSVMYYMAEKKPGELARHLNELTSPMNAFFEKARLDEISPDDPSQALDILKQNGIQYTMTGPGEVTVKVDVPLAGQLRAVDGQKIPGNQDARNAIETVYQSALTHLATKSYDPATDMRDSEVPGETSKGLTEPEKTLMETIIKDNGGVASVTYQAVAGKAAPQPGEEGNSYLYGYTRTFEQSVGDIINALKMNEFVIIGITDTDETGAIVGGHEITITSAFVDKKDGQLKFVVADSDDGVPAPVVRTAKELIPRIHHAGMPVQIARQIRDEQQRNPGYFVPTPADETYFTPLPHAMEPMPDPNAPAAPEPAMPGQAAPEAPVSDPAAAVTSQAVPAPAPQPAAPVAPQPVAPAPPQQVIEWVPVYQYAPAQQMPYIAAQPINQPGAPQVYPQAAYPQAPTQNYAYPAPPIAPPAITSQSFGPTQPSAIPGFVPHTNTSAAAQGFAPMPELPPPPQWPGA